MKSLMIDTATQSGSIALFDDDKLLGEITFNTQLQHLQSLHIAIKYLLELFNTDIQAIKLVGVDIGPGSFTGIRIGVTTARTLAQSCNMFIESETSLKILAYKVPFDDWTICSIIDAKKDRVYACFFQKKKNKIKELTPYYDLSPAEIVQIINSRFNKIKILFVGDAQIKYKDYFKKNIENAYFTDINYYYPEAKNIFYLIKKARYNKEYNKIIPFYLRKSDAEEKIK